MAQGARPRRGGSTDLDTFAGGFQHDIFRLDRERAPGPRRPADLLPEDPTSAAAPVGNVEIAFGRAACVSPRFDVRVALEEWLDAVDSVTPTEPVQSTRGNRTTGIRHLQLPWHKATTTSGSATCV